MLHAYLIRLRQVLVSGRGEIISIQTKQNAVTLVTINYDEDKKTKMNPPERRTPYFL